MEIDCPKFLCDLCAIKSIRPLSYYIEPSPWRLRKDNFNKVFVGMGMYCFWWSGARQLFLDRLVQYRHRELRYTGHAYFKLDHNLIPVYVGRSENAANRMRQRLTAYLSVNLWLMKELLLTERPKGAFGSHNFVLFGYRERVRARVALMAGKPKMSLAEAQEYVIACQQMSRSH
jgi:hypothetical protein